MITDGILTREIDLLHIYFAQLRPHRTLTHDLDLIVEFGLDRALKYLYDKDLLKAVQIFQNLVLLYYYILEDFILKPNIVYVGMIFR